jgi:sRNA-binding regulator protein Hfq
MEILKNLHDDGNPETDNAFMASKSSKKAPEQTFEEVKYLRYLIDNGVPVCIRLSDNEEVRGTIEFFDTNLIRLTRGGAPNLFLYKHEIKYIFETPR